MVDDMCLSIPEGSVEARLARGKIKCEQNDLENIGVNCLGAAI